MNYLKIGLLAVMFAVITLAGNKSSIGVGIESQISGKKSEISGASRNSRVTTTRTITGSQKPPII